MTLSISQLTRVGTGSLHGAVAVIDRGLGLQSTALRNAARAVAADRAAARLRADVEATLSVPGATAA
jgi:hypothetical protein